MTKYFAIDARYLKDDVRKITDIHWRHVVRDPERDYCHYSLELEASDGSRTAEGQILGSTKGGYSAIPYGPVDKAFTLVDGFKTRWDATRYIFFANGIYVRD